MNEYVHVTFALEGTNYVELITQLSAFTHDIVILKTEHEAEWENDVKYADHYMVDAKVNSEFLTALRLSNPELTKHIKVSYIPDELKDYYRKR